jgi:hypothetical protein
MTERKFIPAGYATFVAYSWLDTDEDYIEVCVEPVIAWYLVNDGTDDFPDWTLPMPVIRSEGILFHGLKELTVGHGVDREAAIGDWRLRWQREAENTKPVKVMP